MENKEVIIKLNNFVNKLALLKRHLVNFSAPYFSENYEFEFASSFFMARMNEINDSEI